MRGRLWWRPLVNFLPSLPMKSVPTQFRHLPFPLLANKCDSHEDSETVMRIRLMSPWGGINGERVGGSAQDRKGSKLCFENVDPFTCVEILRFSLQQQSKGCQRHDTCILMSFQGK